MIKTYCINFSRSISRVTVGNYREVTTKTLGTSRIHNLHILSNRLYSINTGSSTVKPPKKSRLINFLYFVSTAASGVAVNQKRTVTTSGLNPDNFTEFTLDKIDPINQNTKLFRFKLEENQKLGIPVTSCVVTKAPAKDGKGVVIRPYTPTSDEDQLGYFDFVIKRYVGGPMSEYIHSLRPGDKLAVKGPFPKLDYTANKYEHVGMLAGGTGITPMLQIIRKAFKDKTDKTKITLVFGNQTEQDILFKKELDELSQKYPDRFKVHYVLDKIQSKQFQGSQGYINKQIVERFMPNKGDRNSIVLVCGPDPMYNALCGPKNPDKSQGELRGLLKDMGYEKDMIYKF